jgi:hypothetical protein
MWLVYSRERKHIRTKWSRVTCLALPLATAQSLGSQVLEDSQSRWHLTIAIGNRQSQTYKKIVHQTVSGARHVAEQSDGSASGEEKTASIVDGLQ